MSLGFLSSVALGANPPALLFPRQSSDAKAAEILSLVFRFNTDVAKLRGNTFPPCIEEGNSDDSLASLRCKNAKEDAQTRNCEGLMEALDDVENVKSAALAVKCEVDYWLSGKTEEALRLCANVLCKEIGEQTSMTRRLQVFRVDMREMGFGYMGKIQKVVDEMEEIDGGASSSKVPTESTTTRSESTAIPTPTDTEDSDAPSNTKETTAPEETETEDEKPSEPTSSSPSSGDGGSGATSIGVKGVLLLFFSALPVLAALV